MFKKVNIAGKPVTPKTVFISGSAGITEITADIRNLITAWYLKGYNFVVGDCRGVDSAVQDILNQLGCPNVTVYFSGYKATDKPRYYHPFDGWKLKRVIPKPGARGREFFTAKDIVMTYESDISLVIWDGKSQGSKANIDRANAALKDIMICMTDGKKLVKKNSEEIANCTLDHEFDEDSRICGLDKAYEEYLAKGYNHYDVIAAISLAVQNEVLILDKLLDMPQYSEYFRLREIQSEYPDETFCKNFIAPHHTMTKKSLCVAKLLSIYEKERNAKIGVNA